jgi:AraC-like DNA-binding protein
MRILPPNTPYAAHAFPRQRRVVPLHAMVVSAGYSRECSQAYDFHGLQRGEAECALFQYTLSGHGALTYEGEHHELRPGTALLLRIPHDHRYYLPADCEAWEFLYTVLNGREVMRLWRWLIDRLGPCPQLHPESDAVATAVAIFEQAGAGGEPDPFAASDQAYRLCMALCRAAAPALDQEARPAFITRALAYCDAHFADPIGVEGMAAAAGYSVAHFSRGFRRHMGVSPRQYLEDLRVNRAIALLRDPTLSIGEIAAATGFAAANYFAKVFRRVTGESPRAFRRRGLY